MSDVYEVDELCGHRIIRGKQFYWVKWKGYDSDQNTWESAENISADLLEAYHAKMEELSSGKSMKPTSATASRLADRASAKEQSTKRVSSAKESAAALVKKPSSPGSTRTRPSLASRPAAKAPRRSLSTSPVVSKEISISPSAPTQSLSPAALRPSSALAVLISKRSPVQDKSLRYLPERRVQSKKSKPSALDDMQSATHDLRNEVAAMKESVRLRNNRSPKEGEQSSEDSTVSTEDRKASRVEKPKKTPSIKKRRRRSKLSTPSRKKVKAEEYFNVEKILGTRVVKGKHQFLVKWEGYPKSQSTWETEESFGANRHLIEEYFESQ